MSWKHYISVYTRYKLFVLLSCNQKINILLFLEEINFFFLIFRYLYFPPGGITGSVSPNVFARFTAFQLSTFNNFNTPPSTGPLTVVTRQLCVDHSEDLMLTRPPLVHRSIAIPALPM